MAVPKGGIRQQWEKDSKKLEAQTWFRPFCTLPWISAETRFIQADGCDTAEEGQVPVLSEGSHYSLYLP